MDRLEEIKDRLSIGHDTMSEDEWSECVLYLISEVERQQGEITALEEAYELAVHKKMRLQAEVERLQHESDVWEKLSLVAIATERDELRVEVERLRSELDKKKES